MMILMLGCKQVPTTIHSMTIKVNSEIKKNEMVFDISEAHLFMDVTITTSAIESLMV